MKIAVSGKGGVGKTTISSNLVKLFAEKGFNVYAVDADPDSSLGLALGISVEELGRIKPIIDMKELIDEKSGNGAFFSLNPDMMDVIENHSIRMGSIRFLRMGAVKQGGSSCYCRENSFLSALVDSILWDVKDVVIMDMGAGIEHLARGTSKGVDMMLIVTEAGSASAQTARVVQKLAEELNIKNVRFIANKIRNDREEAFIRERFAPGELLGVVHYSDDIASEWMDGSQGIGINPEIRRIFDKLVEQKSLY